MGEPMGDALGRSAARIQQECGRFVDSVSRRRRKCGHSRHRFASISARTSGLNETREGKGSSKLLAAATVMAAQLRPQVRTRRNVQKKRRIFKTCPFHSICAVTCTLGPLRVPVARGRAYATAVRRPDGGAQTRLPAPACNVINFPISRRLVLRCCSSVREAVQPRCHGSCALTVPARDCTACPATM